MKKVLKILLCILLAIIVAALAYAAYVLLSWHRLDDALPLQPEGTAASGTAESETPLTLISWNIGFGAYEPDFGFFMDGGTEGRAFSAERLTANLDRIGTKVAAWQPDFLYLQEIDTDGTRSWHVNELELLRSRLDGYTSVYAQNYDSPYLIVPFNSPFGANKAGIVSFSRHPVSSAIRRSLPIDEGLTKVLDLDRCYSVTRVPVSNGSELCLYNFHLSAYTVSNIVRYQLTALAEDMKAEIEKGHYVVAAGDFNMDIAGNSAELFGIDLSGFSWAQPIDRSVLEGSGITLQVPLDPDAPMPTCRNSDGPWNESQAVVILDGFLTSGNVEVVRSEVLEAGFENSDHNPVRLTFILHDDPQDG